MVLNGCIPACVCLRKYVIIELLGLTSDVCLLIINAHRLLAYGNTNSQPSHTHTYVQAAILMCNKLSVPVKLGILVSTRFGSTLTGPELRTLSPQQRAEEECTEKEAEKGRKTD